MESEGVIPRGTEFLLPVTARARRPHHPVTVAVTPRLNPILLMYRHLIDQSVRDSITGFRLGQPSELSRDAMQWICQRGLGNARLEISFDRCCWVLGCDAEKERAKLLQEIWTARLTLSGPNAAALRSRLQSYGRQTRQVHR